MGKVRNYISQISRRSHRLAVTSDVIYSGRVDTEKGFYTFLLSYSDRMTLAMTLENGSQTNSRASTLKWTFTLTLTVNVNRPSGS